MPIPKKYYTEEEKRNALRESNRKYYQNNKEKFSEKSKIYSKEHYDPVKKNAYYIAKKNQKKATLEKIEVSLVQIII